MKLWDDAVQRAEKFIAETKGSFEEAVGRRFLGGLYLIMPHYGTKRGTTFLRGQWSQGVQVHSWRKDRRQAIEQYEHARQILLGLDKEAVKDRILNPINIKELIVAERIGLGFDLVSALANRNTNRYSGWGCFGWWWSSVLEANRGKMDYYCNDAYWQAWAIDAACFDNV